MKGKRVSKPGGREGKYEGADLVIIMQLFKQGERKKKRRKN